MATTVASGHLLRILDITEGLLARGHRVLVHTGVEAEAQVKQAGAEFLSCGHHTDMIKGMVDSMAERPSWFPKPLYGLMQFRRVLPAVGVELAKQLEPILRRERVDCVVYDAFSYGAAWAAERVGLPCASAGNMGTVLTDDELPLVLRTMPALSPLLLVPAVTHALIDALVPFGAARAELGLPPLTSRTSGFVQTLSSAQLHIIMAHRGFAGDVPLRDRQIFVGPTTFNLPAKAEEDALDLAPGTVIVSTTTTGKDNGLLRRVLEAVSTMHLPVLATAANVEDVPTGLGKHIRIEQYIPHDVVFPKARALITHGGWGTVGRALTHGLPMLVIPLFGDQLLNSKLVERAGVGRRLPLDKATPEAIRVELRALLADDAMRARSQRIAADLQQLKADQVAARALEELARGGKAVATSQVTA